MSDDSQLDQLFQAYRAACGEVEPGANFMPELWQRIEGRHPFWSVFQNLARTTVTACAAICLLLVFLNFGPALQHGSVQALNYPDALMAEHSAENTDFTENIHPSAVDEETPAGEHR